MERSVAMVSRKEEKIYVGIRGEIRELVRMEKSWPQNTGAQGGNLRENVQSGQAPGKARALDDLVSRMEGAA